MGQSTSAPCVPFKAQSLKDRSNYENALSAVREDGTNLEYADKEDVRLVTEATIQNPVAFQFASDELRLDPLLVMELLESTEGAVYPYVLVNNPEIDHKAATLCGENLEFMSQESRADKNIVAASVISKGSALKFASDALRDNKDVVMLSIDTFDCGFKYASERLRMDPEVFNYALSVGHYNVAYIPEEAMEEPLMLEVVGRWGRGYQYLPENLKAMKPMALAAVTNFCGAYLYMPEALKDDDEIVKIVLQNTSLLYSELPERYKTKEEAIRCILAGGDCIKSFSEEIKWDPAVLELCIKHATVPLPGYSAEVWREYVDNPLRQFPPAVLAANLTEELACEAVERNFYAYRYLPKVFKDSTKVQKKTMTHWRALKILPKTIDLCLLAVNLSTDAIPDIPSSVRRELFKAYVFQTDLRPLCKVFLWGASYIARHSVVNKKQVVVQIPLQKLNRHGIHFAKLFKKLILSYLGIDYYVHSTVGKALAAMPTPIEVVDDEIDLTGDSD